ncbi:MAG: hypothetical protein ABIF40_04350 [archaeon]
MQNRLQRQRETFDRTYELIFDEAKYLDYISQHHETYQNYSSRRVLAIFVLNQFWEAEIMAERAHVDGFLKGKILGLGLQEHMEAILGGFERSVVSIEKGSASKNANPPSYIRAISDYFLEFGSEYIDRWKMYYELFEENDKKRN